MSAPVPQTRFHIAICGAGIGGLSLALALAPFADIRIDIYEAATRFEEVGAGLAIWGRAVTVLQKLGWEERLRSIAPGNKGTTTFELRNAEIPSGGELLGPVVLSTNMGFHRAQFINLLVDMLSETGRARIHFGKRCLTFTESINNADGGSSSPEIVTMHFADGTSATCDVLIGCDGIRSSVRRELMRNLGNDKTEVLSPQENLNKFRAMQFSGTVAYRALVKPDDLRAIAGEHNAITTRKMYFGIDKHIVTYPVAGGRFINFIAYSSDPTRQVEWENGPWVVDVEKEEVLQVYGDFEPEVQTLLKCINKPSRWTMYEVEPLDFWSKGRVTILGDAAHAMAPFIGCGGGQVIEDVYVLSRLLGSSISTSQTIPAVLRAYGDTRRPRAKKALMCTREARRVLEYQEEYVGAGASEVIAAMSRLTAWLWEGVGGPDDDVREAVKLAQQFLSENAS